MLNPIILQAGIKRPPVKRRTLIRDETKQKKLQDNAGATSSRYTAKTYEKTFLTFLGADLQEGIKVDHLSDGNCSDYIAAVWNAEPFVGPSTIRGNVSHIFHSAFEKLGLPVMKKQKFNFVKTIATMYYNILVLNRMLRWKSHTSHKAGIFNSQ